MAISSWLSNNRVETAFVEYRGYRFLVYTSVVGSHSIVMNEEAQSQVRIIPSMAQRIESGSEMDSLAHRLMDDLIEQNFSRGSN